MTPSLLDPTSAGISTPNTTHHAVTAADAIGDRRFAEVLEQTHPVADDRQVIAAIRSSPAVDVALCEQSNCAIEQDLEGQALVSMEVRTFARAQGLDESTLVHLFGEPPVQPHLPSTARDTAGTPPPPPTAGLTQIGARLDVFELPDARGLPPPLAPTPGPAPATATATATAPAPAPGSTPAPTLAPASRAAPTSIEPRSSGREPLSRPADTPPLPGPPAMVVAGLTRPPSDAVADRALAQGPTAAPDLPDTWAAQSAETLQSTRTGPPALPVSARGFGFGSGALAPSSDGRAPAHLPELPVGAASTVAPSAVEIRSSSAAPVIDTLNLPAEPAETLLRETTGLLARRENVVRVAEQIGEMLAARVIAHVRQGHWQVRLLLSPARLGDIQITLEMRRGELEATFLASQAATREVLGESLARLRTSLNQAGMPVALLHLGSETEGETGGFSTPNEHFSEADTADTAIPAYTASFIEPDLVTEKISKPAESLLDIRV